MFHLSGAYSQITMDQEVLMQEEVTQKTIALVIKTSKLSASVLKAAMRIYLNHQKQKSQKSHGKTSVKKLVGEGRGEYRLSK